jgi:integrase
MTVFKFPPRSHDQINDTQTSGLSSVAAAKPVQTAEVISLFGGSANVITSSISGNGTTPPKKKPKRPTPKEIRSKLFPAVFRREYAKTPTWLVDCRIDGKPTNKTIGPVSQFSEFEACRRGKEHIEALQEGRNPFVGDMSFEAYFDEVRTPWARTNKRSAEDEIGVFNRYIRRKLGRQLMRQIRSHHIQVVIDDYLSGKEATARRQMLSKGTIYQIIAVILAVLNWAYRRGDLPDNPTRRIKQIKLDNARKVRYSESELAAIGKQLESAPALLRLLFTMLLLSGRRISELLNALHEDLNSDANTLLIRDTKSGGDFLLPCSPEFMSAYQELKAYAVPGNPFIFPAKTGNRPMSAPYRQFKEVLAAAGISQRRTFHDARRTVASEAVQIPGIGLIDVARSLHHADATVTARHYIVTDHERIRHTLTLTGARLASMLLQPPQLPILTAVFQPSVRSIRITNRFTFVFAGGC